MDRARVRARVTVEDPNGKGQLHKTIETDAIIFGEGTVTLWLGGESVNVLEAYRQGAGSPVEVYPLAWVQAITFERDGVQGRAANASRC